MQLRLPILSLLLLSLTQCWVGAATVSAKGTVLDAKGAPAPGVSVYAVRKTVIGYDYDNTRFDAPAKTVSDKKGQWRFDSLAKPEKVTTGYTFVAYQPGRQLGWANGRGDLAAYPVDKSPKSYKIFMRDLAPVGGRVVDNDGKPLPGATVELRWIDYGSKPNQPSILAKALDTVIKLTAATTDGQGVFEFVDMPQGAAAGYEVTKPGYARQYEPPISKSVVMAPAGNLAGRVVDENGAPVAGVRVGKADGRRVTTDGNGEYIFRDVLARKYPWSVDVFWKPNMVADATGLGTEGAVNAGETTRLPDMVYRHRVRVTGGVLDTKTGKPISGAEVSVCRDRIRKDSASWLLIDRTKTDKAGRYEVQLPVGTEVSVGATQLLYRSDYRMVTASADPQNVDLKLERESIAKGRVVDEAGHPVRDAWVYIPGAQTGKFAPSQSTVAYVTSDAKGEFQLPVPGTSSSVLLEARKYRPFDLQSSIRDHREDTLAVARRIDRKRLLRGVTVVVKPLRTLTFAVKDASGKPVKDAYVAVIERVDDRPLDDLYNFDRRGPIIRTDEQGKGICHDVVAGAAYDIRVSASGYKYVAMRLPAEGSPGWKGHIEAVLPAR